MILDKCPECGNGQLFGRMGQWRCGNDDCDATWRNEDDSDQSDT